MQILYMEYWRKRKTLYIVFRDSLNDTTLILEIGGNFYWDGISWLSDIAYFQLVRIAHTMPSGIFMN